MGEARPRSGAIGLALLTLSCKAPGPPPLDPAVIARGRQVYATRCARCHGPNGEGAPSWREPDGQGELPPPPHNAEGHTWRHGDGMLYRIVGEGWRDPFNRTTRLTMPPFGDSLSSGDIRAVIIYFKTWWQPEQRSVQWEESQQEPFPPETTGPPR